MSFLTYRVIILVVCFAGFFSIQPKSVSGFRNMLTRKVIQDVDVPLHDIAPSPANGFYPDQAEKRRVRRGSDPIHNRC
ncbi:hypothetical protein F511_02214 [Dorcoceras hygrometricum]|uniref:Uncharacterized protein n=1 Tax=Dorcoceras hygrometricum TaxID=472368 RepID=A0A2Z7ANJ8_9LAMI|nr:hypothetical protein F511_02214 [Dorcoceras hygrometricum]